MKMSDQIIARLERGAENSEQAPDSVGVKFFRLTENEDRELLHQLLDEHPDCGIYDTMQAQLHELIKVRHPHIPFSALDKVSETERILKGRSVYEYGVWVYYPWSNRLVHILDEEEFIELRTSRNLYKITKEEQALLRTKKIGVIGLSVGMTIALCLAMERVCGEIRIADFDTLDLSNLNRLEAGVHEVGTHKWRIAQRRIAELDPYLKVHVFKNGVTDENMDHFLTEGGNLDVLVDECDSLDIKLLCRVKAKALKIPVVMDTNDRGMLDIERFDLEPERPLLHGLAGDLDHTALRNLSAAEKLPVVMKIISAENISERLRYSLGEYGKTIVSWPQLSSAVFLGGAITTEACRQILLNQSKLSGRLYFDIGHVINQTNLETTAQ